MRPRFVAVLVAVAAVPTLVAAPAVKPKGPPTERVDKLFAAMRDGTYRHIGIGFPSLGWEDVPALLARADEEGALAAYPSNPISSFAQLSCREGVIALWLIEGIRKGGRFASLNPSFALSRDRAGATPEELKAAARAYRDWWETAKGKPERAREIDPLADVGMTWR